MAVCKITYNNTRLDSINELSKKVLVDKIAEIIAQDPLIVNKLKGTLLYEELKPTPPASVVAQTDSKQGYDAIVNYGVSVERFFDSNEEQLINEQIDSCRI